MRYLALACDYDGTLAQDGRVSADTISALEKVRSSGRKLILVTGRELEELLTIFPHASLFDSIVAENGALLYHPATRDTKTLAELPPPAFIAALKERKVYPMSVGHVIVATWKPHETAVLGAIRDLGLELQVIFNKDAVMILPAGVNKATGLSAALKELELSAHEVVGVGDAENDHAFLSICECAVAVANALPMVKERVDLVTLGDHGRGVEMLIEQLLVNDLQDIQGKLSRHHVRLGHRDSGEEVRFAPFGCNLVVAGPSSSATHMVSRKILKRLQEHHYQLCIVGPQGESDGLEGAVCLGSRSQGPVIDEILQLLKKPESDVVVNLTGVPVADRSPFVQSLLPRLQEMRDRVGRPHWIVVEEAQHLLPSPCASLPRQLDRMVILTEHPQQIMASLLEAITAVIAFGPEPDKTIAQFCRAAGAKAPDLAGKANGGAASTLSTALFWRWREENAPVRVNVD